MTKDGHDGGLREPTDDRRRTGADTANTAALSAGKDHFKRIKGVEGCIRRARCKTIDRDALSGPPRKAAHWSARMYFGRAVDTESFPGRSRICAQRKRSRSSTDQIHE